SVKLVHELVAGDVVQPNLRIASHGCLADGVEQVRFAQADAAMNEERVVRLAEFLSDGECGGMGQPISGADDKVLKRVIRADEHFLINERGSVVAAGLVRSPVLLVAVEQPAILGEIILADESERKQSSGSD